MSAKKPQSRGLGRGFESLIPTDFFDESFDPTANDDRNASELRNIKLAEITADKDQPRQHFDDSALAELAASIEAHGVLQPIVVTVVKGGGYQIVAGERRFRASKIAGQKTIPAIVRTLSAQHTLELALIENLQRRDLNALETATSYAKLRDQFNLTLEQIGKSVGGKSVSSISNTLRLLKLPKVVQQAIFEGKISEGQARPLVDFDEKRITALLPKIIDEQWSARKIEAEIRSEKQTRTSPERKQAPLYETYEKKLHSAFNAPVKIKKIGKDGGQIVISFKSQAELESFSKRFEN